MKLEKYEQASKTLLIKEIKNLLQDMNLVQVMHEISCFPMQIEHPLKKYDFNFRLRNSSKVLQLL